MIRDYKLKYSHCPNGKHFNLYEPYSRVPLKNIIQDLTEKREEGEKTFCISLFSHFHSIKLKLRNFLNTFYFQNFVFVFLKINNKEKKTKTEIL